MSIELVMLSNQHTVGAHKIFLDLGKREGFPGGASGKELTCRYRRLKRDVLHPWVRKIPWRESMAPCSSILA